MNKNKGIENQIYQNQLQIFGNNRNQKCVGGDRTHLDLMLVKKTCWSCENKGNKNKKTQRTKYFFFL